MPRYGAELSQAVISGWISKRKTTEKGQNMSRDRKKTEIDMFIRSLKNLPLTRQQKRTLKGQAIAGDIDGATKGLNKIIKQAI